MAVFHVARAPVGAVFIGRPSRWGNPFHLDAYESRSATIERYRIYLWQEIQTGNLSLEDLAALHGSDLACFCKPHPCHGDVLERAAAWAYAQLNPPRTDV